MAAWIGTALTIFLKLLELYQEWRAKTSEVQRRALERENEKAELRKAVAEGNGEEVTRLSRATHAIIRELLLERKLRKDAPNV